MVLNHHVIIFILLKMHMDQQFIESLTIHVIQNIFFIYVCLIHFLVYQQSILTQLKLNWHQNT
jgi:hypothetical protein